MSTSNNERYVDYLDFSKSSWKRPEGPPRIWCVVDGRRKMANGEIPKFSIQEVPKEFEDDVVDFMLTHFIIEEPISVDMGISSNPLAVREIRTFWRDIVNQGVSVVALTVDSDPAVKPVIAGVNILCVVTAEDEVNSGKMTKFRTVAMQKTMGVQSKLINEANVLKKYGVDRYLGAYGLSVDPALRGQGLGDQLLRARDDIGLAYKIPVSETIFTGPASQTLATRVGFEVLLERKYSELLDDEGNVAFPGVTVKSIKVMGKRLYN